MKIKKLNADQVWDFENGFHWFSDPSRLNKILAHYELYKKIINIPGDVFEFGVFKGGSLIRFLTFRNMLESNTSRKIVGFDTFGEFPNINVSNKNDKEFISTHTKVAGDSLSKEEMTEIINFKKFDNVELIKGNIFETLEIYLKKNRHTKLSLLHMDLDVFEPTEFALNLLYERVARGGIIIFDDYPYIEGAMKAVDTFLSKYDLKIQKLPFYKIPSFIIKK